MNDDVEVGDAYAGVCGNNALHTERVSVGYLTADGAPWHTHRPGSTMTVQTMRLYLCAQCSLPYRGDKGPEGWVWHEELSYPVDLKEVLFAKKKPKLLSTKR